MGAGGNGNSRWEWEKNRNKTRLNVGWGTGMGMNHWGWEGLRLQRTFSLIVYTCKKYIIHNTAIRVRRVLREWTGYGQKFTTVTTISHVKYQIKKRWQLLRIATWSHLTSCKSLRTLITRGPWYTQCQILAKSHKPQLIYQSAVTNEPFWMRNVSTCSALKTFNRECSHNVVQVNRAGNGRYGKSVVYRH